MRRKTPARPGNTTASSDHGFKPEELAAALHAMLEADGANPVTMGELNQASPASNVEASQTAVDSALGKRPMKDTLADLGPAPKAPSSSPSEHDRPLKQARVDPLQPGVKIPLRGGSPHTEDRPLADDPAEISFLLYCCKPAGCTILAMKDLTLRDSYVRMAAAFGQVSSLIISFYVHRLRVL